MAAPNSSLLSELLTESPDYRNPLKGFLLAAPYISTSHVVPMTRSASAPPICFSDRVSRGDFGDSGLDRPQPTDLGNWQCRGCDSTDRALLTIGSDSSTACDLCGTVDSDVSLISLSRQKNCPMDEDKTVVADEPRRDERVVASEAFANGDENSNDRRKRHLHGSEGTRVARTVLRRYDLGAAQARVDAGVVRDSRERMDGDPLYTRKRSAVLRFVTAVQELLGSTLDERIRRHMRLEAVRVVTSGFEHAKSCNDATCQIAIPTRANALVALCTIQKCIECLLNEESTVASVSDIAPEVSRQQLMKSLDETRQMQTKGTGVNQRAQVASVVGIVLGWSHEQVCIPCSSAVDSPTLHDQPTSHPPPFLLPPPRVTPSPIDTSDNDTVWAVRNLIHGAGRLSNARGDVRKAATAAVQEDNLVEWINTENILPLCVLGVVILRAAGIKLGVDSGTEELLAQYCSEYDIAVSTAHSVAVYIAGIIRVESSTTLGIFQIKDGIF